MIKIMLQTLACLFRQVPEPELLAGSTVFLTGQRVQRLYLVLEGRVELQRHTAHGTTLVLQNAGPGSILAEASAYSTHYHCDARVVQTARLAVVTKSAFLAALDQNPALARAWSCMLANSVQAARLRAEIRSLPTVASRLDAWLEQDNQLPEKGHWQTLAAQLSVTPAALYRELAKRRTKSKSV